MRVGILGATGMLGHHVALAVAAAGDEPVVLHRSGANMSRVEDIQALRIVADLDKPHTLISAFSRLDGVIHCAGHYPTLPRPWRVDVEHARRQTENFLDACKRTRLARVVYVGSSIALRRAPDGGAGHEGLIYVQPPEDHNPYLQVKWVMDHLCAEAAMEGMNLSLAIPSMCLGEYDFGPSTGQLVTRLARGVMPAYVRGNRNVIYAGDAAHGIYRVYQDGLPGERYLLTGANITMDDLMSTIANAAGVRVPRAISLSSARAVSGWQALRYRFLSGPEPQISPTAIAVMAYGQFLSGDKTFNALHFNATTGIEQAVRRSLDWFRKVGYIPEGPSS